VENQNRVVDAAAGIAMGTTERDMNAQTSEEPPEVVSVWPQRISSDHSKTRTPVHEERLTSDESGVVASKKDNRRRDLLRTGKSPHWHFG
jgi:hypothetical protein